MSAVLSLVAAFLLAMPEPAGTGTHRTSTVPDPGSRHSVLVSGAAVAAMLAFVAVADGPALLLAPVPGIVVAVVVRRAARSAARLDPHDTALVLELAASVIAGGVAVDRALTEVAAAARETDPTRWAAVVGPLETVGRSIQLGADPGTAWAGLVGVAGLREFGEAAARSAHSGARLSEAIADTVGRLRATARGAATARANRTGVWSLLPLGGCFLPAFVCLGMVPFVGGIASQFAGGLR